MPLQKKEIKVFKWSLRVHRPSAVDNTVKEKTLDIDEVRSFPEMKSGVFFNPPSGYVLDAETLRAVADHLDELNEQFVAKEPTPEPTKKSGKDQKTSFTLGH